MDEFDKDQVIEWYKWLEKQLLDIMVVLPPAPGNLESYSPRIASLILDACGLIDSIFLQITPKHEIERIEREDRNPNITDWADLYSGQYKLPMLKSIPLISPPHYLSPFESWTDIASGGDYKPLDWWQTYNKLKHDRIAHMRSARLDVAINALCGLHQVIAVVPHLVDAVMKAGWINLAGVNPKWLLEIIKEQTKLSHEQGYLVESGLFITPLRIKVPDNIEDFKPVHWNASNRVAAFFGRWF